MEQLTSHIWFDANDLVDLSELSEQIKSKWMIVTRDELHPDVQTYITWQESSSHEDPFMNIEELDNINRKSSENPLQELPSKFYDEWELVNNVSRQYQALQRYLKTKKSFSSKINFNGKVINLWFSNVHEKNNRIILSYNQKEYTLWSNGILTPPLSLDTLWITINNLFKIIKIRNVNRVQYKHTYILAYYISHRMQSIFHCKKYIKHEKSVQKSFIRIT